MLSHHIHFVQVLDLKWFSLLLVALLLLLENTPVTRLNLFCSWTKLCITPVLVVTGKTANISQIQCPVSERVNLCSSGFPESKAHTHSRTYWLRVCVRPLMVSIKMIRLLVPTVFVPMASLLGSFGSPCSLSHDDLDRTYIHTLTLTIWRLRIHIPPQ